MASHRLRTQIGGPEVAHGVTSPEQYREHARQFLARLGVPPAEWLRPAGTRPMYVSGGWSLVRCDCGNAPSASPEWKLAICLECGAEYAVSLPRDWDQAERALLARDADHRHFFPKAAAKHLGLAHDGETATGLHRENAKHGAV